MNDSRQIPKSYIRIYWVAWAISLGILIYTEFRGANDDNMFSPVMIYMAVSWMAIMVISFCEQLRFNSYLEEHHHEKWVYLSYGLSFWMGPRGLSFLFSKDNLNDPVVKWFKSNIKRFITFALTVFFSYVVLGFYSIR